MGRSTPTETTDEPTENETEVDRLTRADVRTMRPETESEDTDGADAYRTVFEDLLTPRTRAAILDVLVEARGQPLSVTQMTRENPNVSSSSFDRHRDDLLAYGVMEKAGKVGNAMTYRLSRTHPAAQLLAMLDNIMLYGETPMLLDEYFVSGEDAPFKEGVE